MALDRIEVAKPDLRPYRVGNTGIPYVTRFDSNRPGPSVVVNALTHGNELCGAIAIDTLFRNGVRPAKGSLTLSFANVEAFERFDPANPDRSRFVDEDMNRVWDTATLDGPRRSRDLDRARELRPVIDTADLLLDIHSMTLASPPLSLCGPTLKGRELAVATGDPPLVVIDKGHQAGRRMRDYGAFADESSPKNALLTECGPHWLKTTADVAIRSTLRFLRWSGILEPNANAPGIHEPSSPAKLVDVTEAVTIRTDAFEFVRAFEGMEVIEQAGTVIARDGDASVRTPYDHCILVMPTRRLDIGRTAVRFGRYVSAPTPTTTPA